MLLGQARGNKTEGRGSGYGGWGGGFSALRRLTTFNMHATKLTQNEAINSHLFLE